MIHLNIILNITDFNISAGEFRHSILNNVNENLFYDRAENYYNVFQALSKHSYYL